MIAQLKKTWNRESSIFHNAILIPYEIQQWRRLFDNIALEIWRVCRSKCLYIRSNCFIVCWSGCLECESVVVFLFHGESEHICLKYVSHPSFCCIYLRPPTTNDWLYYLSKGYHGNDIMCAPSYTCCECTAIGENYESINVYWSRKTVYAANIIVVIWAYA